MFKNKSKLFLIIGGLLIYLASAGVSYGAFRFLGGGNTLLSPVDITPTGGLKIDPNAPKTETCPLDGQLFSKAERQIWGKEDP